jgi:hypothetical protein
MLGPGRSADDVFNAYWKKNEVNFKRQDSGTPRKTTQLRTTSELRPISG